MCHAPQRSRCWLLTRQCGLPQRAPAPARQGLTFCCLRGGGASPSSSALASAASRFLRACFFSFCGGRCVADRSEWARVAGGSKVRGGTDGVTQGCGWCVDPQYCCKSLAGCRPTGWACTRCCGAAPWKQQWPLVLITNAGRPLLSPLAPAGSCDFLLQLQPVHSPRSPPFCASTLHMSLTAPACS